MSSPLVHLAVCGTYRRRPDSKRERGHAATRRRTRTGGSSSSPMGWAATRPARWRARWRLRSSPPSWPISTTSRLPTPRSGWRGARLANANRAVYERTTNRSGDKLGMGSTVFGPSAVGQQVSRRPRRRFADLHRPRRSHGRSSRSDHSLVQEHVDAGLLTAEQARHHPQSNVITCASGWPTRSSRTCRGETRRGSTYFFLLPATD